MSGHQRMGSIFWLIIGIYVAVASYRLGLGRLYKPGPGFMFFLSSLFLVILSTIDLVGNFRRPQIEKERKVESIWRGLRWHKVLVVLGSLVAYVYFLNALGFFLSTFFLMVFLYKAVDPTKWWVAVASSLITTLIAYAIFKVWLQVPFPAGILEF